MHEYYNLTLTCWKLLRGSSTGNSLSSTKFLMKLQSHYQINSDFFLSINYDAGKLRDFTERALHEHANTERPEREYCAQIAQSVVRGTGAAAALARRRPHALRPRTATNNTINTTRRRNTFIILFNYKFLELSENTKSWAPPEISARVHSRPSWHWI